MKIIIFMTLFVICACTNGTRDAQNVRNDQNPSLHTIGYIGDVKVQVGIADQPELK